MRNANLCYIARIRSYYTNSHWILDSIIPFLFLCFWWSAQNTKFSFLPKANISCVVHQIFLVELWRSFSPFSLVFGGWGTVTRSSIVYLTGLCVNYHCGNVESKNVKKMVLFRRLSFKRWKSSLFSISTSLYYFSICMLCSQVWRHTSYVCLLQLCTVTHFVEFLCSLEKVLSVDWWCIFMNLSHFICPSTLCFSSHLLCHPGSFSLSFQILLAFLLIWFDSLSV